MSGFIYIDTHQLHPGSACIANGFFALLTFQAANFTITAMVLVTILTVTGVVTLADLSNRWTKLAICATIWTTALIMSTAAGAIDSIMPVGANWCWIDSSREGLRLALVEGWWLAIVFLSVSTYCFIWCFISRRCVRLFSFGRIHAGRCGGTDNYIRFKSSDHESGDLPYSKSASPVQTLEVAIPTTKEEDFPEFMLPIQGGKKSMDGNPESSTRSVQARPPHGPINSFRSHPPISYKTEARTGPNYHNQCPKVTRSFDVAVAVAPGAPVQPRNGTGDEKPAPRYHNQCPKVTKSFDVVVNSFPAPSTASSGTLPHKNGRPEYPHRNVTGRGAGPGPRYHNQCPKVQRTFEVATDVQPPPLLGEKPLPRPTPATRYHHQLSRTGSITPLGPPPRELPPLPPATLRPDPCRSSTTIVTSPWQPPPSPTPGLPPPPWDDGPSGDGGGAGAGGGGVGGADSPRRRTFFLSRSTWSDLFSPSSTSKRGSGAGTGAGGGRPRKGGDSSSCNRRGCEGGGDGDGDGDAVGAMLEGPRRRAHLLLPLAAYPLVYVALWLPAVVQCLLDVSGAAPSPADSLAMATLLGTGQYVGLGHAVTFAVEEVLGRQGRQGGRGAECCKGMGMKRRSYDSEDV